MYVPRRLTRAGKPYNKLSFAAGVAKKRKQRRQNRPGTPTKTLEFTEVSFPPTQSLAIRQKHDVPPGAVVSATAYEHAPPGAVASTMTPEVLRTLPEPCSSDVFGVWLLDQIEHIYTEHRSHCLKDDEDGSLKKTRLGMIEVTVPDNGQAIPFEAMSAMYPNLQKIQLLQGVQFIFYSPESLLRFTFILISTLFAPHPQPIVPWVHIKLIIFDPTCLPEAPELMAWEEIGVDQDPPASWTLAYEHYDDWMKAVERFCKLPLVALVTLHFCYPYRNFDNLESLSRPLRITETLGLLPIEFEEES